MLGPDHFAHQHGAGRPFTAETKALQSLEDEQLLEGLGEGREKGGAGEP